MWKTALRAAALAIAGLVALQAPAQAQDEAASFPNKPVRLIVAYPPGGGPDVIARLLSVQLSRMWGQPVVVENKVGASGLIATEAVLTAPPDGYTVLVGGSATMVFNPIVFGKLPYAPIDLQTVTILGGYPLVIAARADLPVKTFADVVKLAKEKQGKMTYGHPASTFLVQMEYLNTKSGGKMTPVAYRGGAAAAQGIMSGDTDLIVSDWATIEPAFKAGKVRVVAVTTRERNAKLKDVPTVAEAGMDLDMSVFSALGVHRRTPPAIVTKLHQAVAQALAVPEVRDRMLQLGMEVGGISPAASAARIRREIDAYTPAAEAAGVRGTQSQ